MTDSPLLNYLYQSVLNLDNCLNHVVTSRLGWPVMPKFLLGLVINYLWTYSTRRSVVSICIGVLMCTLASVRRPRTLISILTFVSCV